jgi:hypothetical protein
MVAQIPRVKSPAWLTKLSAGSIENRPFPLDRILQGSLYYPASGLDGDPVRYLSRNVQSFVYADYGRERDEFMRALHGPEFLGYEVLAMREIGEAELAPRGWHRPPGAACDGEPNACDVQPPFFAWVVMQRPDDYPDNHGPRRFSLLYLCIDGVAAFQTLYVERGVSPKAIAIIQPGESFGGNYTDFKDPERSLGRAVLGNPAGAPQFLLYGGYGKQDGYGWPCWPRYPERIRFIEKSGGGSVGVWSRAPD